MVSLNVGGITSNSVRNTEIDQLQLSFYKNEVGWLQVGMNNLLIMDYLHSLQHLLPIISNPNHIHGLFLLFLQKAGQIFVVGTVNVI